MAGPRRRRVPRRARRNDRSRPRRTRPAVGRRRREPGARPRAGGGRVRSPAAADPVLSARPVVCERLLRPRPLEASPDAGPPGRRRLPPARTPHGRHGGRTAGPRRRPDPADASSSTPRPRPHRAQARALWPRPTGATGRAPTRSREPASPSACGRSTRSTPSATTSSVRPSPASRGWASRCASGTCSSRPANGSACSVTPHPAGSPRCDGQAAPGAREPGVGTARPMTHRPIAVGLLANAFRRAGGVETHVVDLAGLLVDAGHRAVVVAGLVDPLHNGPPAVTVVPRLGQPPGPGRVSRALPAGAAPRRRRRGSPPRDRGSRPDRRPAGAVADRDQRAKPRRLLLRRAQVLRVRSSLPAPSRPRLPVPRRARELRPPPRAPGIAGVLPRDVALPRSASTGRRRRRLLALHGRRPPRESAFSGASLVPLFVPVPRQSHAGPDGPADRLRRSAEGVQGSRRADPRGRPGSTPCSRSTGPDRPRHGCGSRPGACASPTAPVHGRSSRPSLQLAFQLARVVAVPSRVPESFGLVGLWVMMHARPVVALGSGGTGDWCEDEVTGLCVAPGDHLDLRRGLSRLLDEPGLAERLGNAGHRRAITQLHPAAPSRHPAPRLRARDRDLPDRVAVSSAHPAQTRAPLDRDWPSW